MEGSFIQNATDYAARNGLQLAERLGFGIHGIIFVAEDKSAGGKTAIKAHRALEPFLREVSVYHRLQEANVTEILGFHVPQVLRSDEDLRVIEMTIVTRPFVLDFAGAYLEAPPDFPEDVWAEWEAEKRDQFDVRWPKVRAILGALEDFGIHMVDVSPSNIAFLD
ncbi:MAG TPA: hypothetical protein VKY92_21765 [Verrucomicrobiae bacterium]|nr:hypothetical protein [Verrucomicrobiae bacterium]